MSAFRANKELSKIEYQKYAVKSTSRYSHDIASFYGSLPTSERYQTLRKYSDTVIYSNYEFQYEDQYHFGATHNITKLYDEQYSLFAPIWLDKKIPSKFVVYRIEDVKYKQNYAETTDGQTSRLIELLSNATIVKTFDLSNSSKIGEYLSNHVNDNLFPNALISINFKEGEQSTFNGIDIINGGFANKPEQLDNYYTQVDYPEVFSNEIITNGFERNSLACANLINLEFLFDDNDATNYNIYRYFGIYVDDTVEGSFISEGVTDSGLIRVNESTYKTEYDLSGTSLTSLDMFPNVIDFGTPELKYVIDKNKKLYNLKEAINTPHNSLIISVDSNVDSLFGGYGKTGKTITSITKTLNGRGFIKLTVTSIPNHNDRIFIGDKTELEISNYNLGEYVILADSTIVAGRADGNKFSNQGSLQQIAIAISQAINNGEVITYKTKVFDTSIVIEDYAAGSKRRQNALGIYTSNFVNFIEINAGELNNIGLIDSIVPAGTPTVFSDWSIYTMIGGAVEGQSILVAASEIGNVKVGEWVKQKDFDKFIQIIEVVKDPIDSDLYRIILNAVTKVSNDNVFEIYEIYRTSHGRFSAYDFKDFDFDFYSTRNSKLGDLTLDTHYDNENPPALIDLGAFYAGLDSVLNVERVEDSVAPIAIKNEYDRLNENKLKETALKSRIVPTICKFELKDSSNARNLPYVLNVNEAFGADNLSPNIELDSNRRTEYMNMEHFHINKIPADLRASTTKQDLNNYIDFAGDGGLTLTKLKDVSFNYFDSHFNWNGYYDTVNQVWHDNTHKKLWSRFDIGNSEKNSSTVFRGLRYSYRKRKEIIKAIPTEFISDSNVSDYKFGVVFSYYNIDDVNGEVISDNTLTINSVKNDKFKFICILIELNLVENDITELDRYLMYTLNDIDSGNNILNTSVPFYIDFNASSFDPVEQDNEATLNASNFAVTDGSAKFTNYIKPDSFGQYSWIYFQILSTWYAVKVLKVISDDSVIVAGWPYEFDINTGLPTIPSVRVNPTQFSLIPINATFKYYAGGKNGFANILNEVNAYRFANKFNTFGDIKYTNISVDGKITYNDYVLSVESGVDIIKPSLIVAQTDPDRPKAYQLSSGEIGSIITDRPDGGYLTLLRRMNGDYIPIFNNVVTFSDVHSNEKITGNGATTERSKLIYNKFNGRGVAFDSYKLNRDDYGYINNYFYHKANDEDSNGILKLSQTSDKLPVYPVINEIAIDKKNINVFKSKYSSDYFSKSLAAGAVLLVNGTLSPVEKKSFMASTIMKVKDTYDITTFTNAQETSIEYLDKIRLNKINVKTIHWFEDDQQVIADVYLGEAILGELIEDGIQKPFAKYVDPLYSYGEKSTIDDDLKLYTKTNVTPRFIIDLIDIYGIEGKNLTTDFKSALSFTDLTTDSFRKLTNFNIQGYQNDGLSFRLIYNKRRGYSYNFKIHVKIQA